MNILMVMPWADYVRKAAAEGLRVYSIWDPNRIEADEVDDIVEYSEELILTDFGDEAQLRRLVASTAVERDVAYVLHLGEERSQLPICEEAATLGLAPNPPDALRRINDKAAMRRLLRERGHSPVLSVTADTPREAAGKLAEVGLPAVAKPARLSGSRGVRLIGAEHELRDWAEWLDSYGYAGPVLLEEFLRGPEFSVETLSANGRHHVVGVTAKTKGPPPEFVELRHVHPAALPDADRAAIAEVVTALLDAAGYRFGPAHTEVILTADGPRIVESQTRVAGDRIHHAVELATGFDIEAAIFRALAGKPVEVGDARGVGCVSFFRLTPGRVRSVDGLEEIRALPFVHDVKFRFRPGDVVPETRDSGSRHGLFIIDAASQEEAAERVATVHGMLTVVTAPE